MERFHLYKFIIMSLCTLFSFSNTNGQSENQPGSIRPTAVAGSFYPDNKDSIIKMMSDFFRPYENNKSTPNVAAIIVPHAGYVFSGSTAASAYAQILKDKKYEHIFLIGPSHHIYMEGASINNQYEYYSTPLGNIKVDTTLCNKLIRENKCFSYNASAHDKEHCIEVQLPFIQYHIQTPASIVPIIIGTQSMTIIQDMAKALVPYFNDRNLFIISSDFSHYPSYDDAKIADKLTGQAIENGSSEDFIRAIHKNKQKHIYNLATSACGESAIYLLLHIIEKTKNIIINHISYCNSGDSKLGDRQQVVGYHTFAFIRESPKNDSNNDFTLTEEEKSTLLNIARIAIVDRLNHIKTDSQDGYKLTQILKTKCGAFVTLNEGNKLRGCIGHFGSDEPLYRVVENMAAAAAFEDPRFYPLQHSELNKINIEISVLSPLKHIHSIDEFTLGKQGIYISKNGRSGTFLPQVAEEVNWTKEEFLGHCSQDKAGIGWDGWKDAQLYTYEAIVFKEKDK